ncbi:bombyxin B-2 homolog [Anopheles ziemanni]|uniref:bombyxin B-2 homolog n=1 Tax=Anopheles coustani TaxID=139045 RepID=UPI00265B5F58|nr:bombyxin B-2 homolog [Anopheles coustani]XP_058129486.1 bombyxin B-2 homolog [Anopheles coustani]XP_058129487.1 bombyxin B-2 homolog [Anopheles coustani]XP_058171123.1 bombyxin B-2 homolog [Anopheles ziemanni]XP_058171124.1 bombyxin B-2 homolog [Anopheles ziemanni]
MRSGFIGMNTILFVAVVVLLLLDETKGNSTPNSDALISHLTRSRYCGRRLTETLAFLCQGRYPMLTHYRTDYYHDQQQQQQRVKVEVATLPDTLPPGFPYPGTGVHRRSRRSTGGIYDECCKKSCSYVELRAYCD